MICDRVKPAKNVGMALRAFFLSTWIIGTVAVFLMIPNSASSETQTEFTTFRFLSPGAREIVVPDTATMDEVLEVLRSNNVPFDGPHEITVDDGKGGQVVGGYRMKLEFVTYNPGGTTSPYCPYKQTTNIWFGQNRRLQHYTVVLLVTCVE